MPHARANDDGDTADSSFLGSIDWPDVGRSALNEARELGRRGMDFGQRGLELVRQRPREAAAAGAVGGVALLAGLAYAAWRGRSRRLAIA